MHPVADAEIVFRWSLAGLDGLAVAREELDASNVYPVPDRDTGTNLLLTMESAVSAAREYRDGGMGDIVNALAAGALAGARGNSGSILAQMLRGLADVLGEPGVTLMGGNALAEGLSRAADEAFRAVAIPVVGTILTVARAAGQAARRQAAVPVATLPDVALAAAKAGHVALAETPKQLDVLREAGVVDAGGRGLTVLLDAFSTILTGGHAPSRPASERVKPGFSGDGASAGGRPAGDGASADRAVSVQRRGLPGSPAYEVTYLIEAPAARIDELKSVLADQGDSLVVAGGDLEWNVHVHVDDPGAAVEAGIRAGRPHGITITQLNGWSDPAASTRTATASSTRTVLSLAAGDGLAALYASAGAAVLAVTAGRQPSAPQMLAAIGDATAMGGATAMGDATAMGGTTDEVVILPNSRGTVWVAEAAVAELCAAGRRAAVIPTVAQVQALAALAVHDPGRSFDADVIAMTNAAAHTRHGAVTVAERAATTKAGPCQAGDILGMIEGDVAVIGSDLLRVGVEVITRMLAAGGELVTIVAGADAGTRLATDTASAVRAAHPQADAVVYQGDQPGYPLLLGVE